MAPTIPARRGDAFARRLTVILTHLAHGFARHWLALANLALGLYIGLPLLAPVLMHEGYAGAGSLVVFDCVRSAVLRGASGADETRLVRSVERANEQWRFGLDADEVAPYLAPYSLRVVQCWGAPELEATYFTTPAGRVVGRVNGSHLLVTAEVVESPLIG